MTKVNTYYYKAARTLDGWIKAKAKTERGAKIECSMAYHDAAGAYFYIGIDDGNGQIIEVAVRSAFERWRKI